MEEWKECQIGATSIMLIDGDRGKNYPSQNEFSPLGFCLFLNAGNVTKDGFSFESNLFITEEKDKILRNGKLQKNDIVITTRGTVGNVALYNDNVPYKHLRINSGMLIVRGGIDFDSKYLYYYIKSQLFQNQIQQMKTGSAQPQLPKSTVVNMIVRYPQDISTQQKIANILSSLDDKIEVNRRINEQLEELAGALFKSWFVDFEPFKDGEFVESELGMIPKGWKVVEIQDFGNIICGKTPSKDNKDYYGGDIPFIKIPDMHNNIFVKHTEDWLSEEGNLSQIKKRIPPYSICVSCIATVGLVIMNTTYAHTNQQINTIIPNNEYERYYLFEQLKSMKEYIQNLGRGGTATLNVNTKTFSKIKVLRPFDTILENYDSIVSGIFEKIELNQQEIHHLTTLRDTLLPKLMSGEIDVNEVKI